VKNPPRKYKVANPQGLATLFFRSSHKVVFIKDNAPPPETDGKKTVNHRTLQTENASVCN